MSTKKATAAFRKETREQFDKIEVKGFTDRVAQLAADYKAALLAAPDHDAEVRLKEKFLEDIEDAESRTFLEASDGLNDAIANVDAAEAKGKSESELKQEARTRVKYNPGDIVWDADIEQHGVVVAQHETVIVYRGKGSEKVGPGMVGQYIEACDLIARADGYNSFSPHRFVIEAGARVKAVPCGFDKTKPMDGTIYEVGDIGVWVKFDDHEEVMGDATGNDGWHIRPCMWENISPLLDSGLDVYNEAMAELAKKNVEAA